MNGYMITEFCGLLYLQKSRLLSSLVAGWFVFKGCRRKISPALRSLILPHGCMFLVLELDMNMDIAAASLILLHKSLDRFPPEPTERHYPHFETWPNLLTHGQRPWDAGPLPPMSPIFPQMTGGGGWKSIHNPDLFQTSSFSLTVYSPSTVHYKVYLFGGPGFNYGVQAMAELKISAPQM